MTFIILFTLISYGWLVFRKLDLIEEKLNEIIERIEDEQIY